MKKKQLLIPLLCLLILSMAAMACNFEDYRSTPVSDPASTVDPEAPQPGVVETEPEVAASEEVPPSEEAPPPPTAWLPHGTIAIFSAGSWEVGRLHALAGDGSTTDLGRDVYGSRALSVNGRWVASENSPHPATSVLIANLETSATYSIPISTDFTVYGMAFDATETRLAFMELGFDGSMSTLWAIVVVDLADGSTTRFDASFSGAPVPDILPGNPKGWTETGDELILDTFMPGTEGNWAGVWALTIPHATPSAPLDSLTARELVPMGDLFAQPVLSRDGARMLYIDRESGYTPTDYVVMAYDMAVNQLLSMDFPVGSGTMLLDVVDGSALLRSAAWSMSADRILFAQGTYSGADVFAALTLKFITPGGPVVDVGVLPIPPGVRFSTLDWCRPEIALTTARTAANLTELSIVSVPGAVSSAVTSDTAVSVLGCVP